MIELLIVLIILSLLAGIAASPLRSALRQQSDSGSGCASRLALAISHLRREAIRTAQPRTVRLTVVQNGDTSNCPTAAATALPDGSILVGPLQGDVSWDRLTGSASPAPGHATP